MSKKNRQYDHRDAPQHQQNFKLSNYRGKELISGKFDWSYFLFSVCHMVLMADDLTRIDLPLAVLRFGNVLGGGLRSKMAHVHA